MTTFLKYADTYARQDESRRPGKHDITKRKYLSSSNWTQRNGDTKISWQLIKNNCPKGAQGATREHG